MANFKYTVIEVEGDESLVLAAMEQLGLKAPLHRIDLQAPQRLADQQRQHLATAARDVAQAAAAGGNLVQREGAEEPADPPAMEQPASAPAKSGRSIRLECRQRPGETFSTQQAADLAGVNQVTVYSSLAYAAKTGKEWTSTGDYNFRRIQSPPPAATADVPPTYEARPRSRSGEGPINPNVIGGAAKVGRPCDPKPYGGGNWKPR